MERFPNNNLEIDNQESAPSGDAEKQPLSYEEEQEKREYYKRTFNEMRHNGTVPEGVTDPYELREYMEETEARAAEQSESDRTLLTEITSIKEPKDKNLAISYLVSSFTDDGSKFRNNDERLGLEFILDYAKKKDKHDSAITEFLNSNTQFNHQYDYIPIDKIEMIDDWAKKYESIQQKNDDQNSHLPIVDFCRENRLSLYGRPMFAHYMDDIDNEDSAFSLGEEDFVERPKQDRGILLHMAEKRVQKLEDDSLNDKERSLVKNELSVIGRFYGGESFGNQFRRNEYFMKKMAEVIHKEEESISVNVAMDYYAIHEIAEEFDSQKSLYETFQEYLAEGQQILDNFNNNSET